MHALLLSLAIALQPAPIQRDAYGVPLVRAANEAEAFYGFGRAVAEDRLWQMEMSRRVARGRMAEVLGRTALNADREFAKTGYTDDEIQRQVDSMPQRVRTLFSEYAKGVNDTIAAKTQSNTLPPGYAANGFQPEPWTPLGSSNSLDAEAQESSAITRSSSISKDSHPKKRSSTSSTTSHGRTTRARSQPSFRKTTH
jgi:acyl-homoserine lactone acylase PvdQ